MKARLAGLIVVSSLISHFGTAGELAPNFVERFVRSMMDKSKICLPLEDPAEANLDPAMLETRLSSLRKRSKYNHCEAAKVAYRISLNLEISKPDESLHWGEETVKELLEAKEYDYVVEYGMKCLNDLNFDQINPNEPEKPVYTHKDIEEMRFLILRAVYSAAIEMGADRSPNWLEWSLSLSSDRFIPVARPLQFLTFMLDYSESKHMNEVKFMMQKVTNLFVTRSLIISKVYETKKEYLAVFLTLNDSAKYRDEYMLKAPDFHIMVAKLIDCQMKLAELLKKTAKPKWTVDYLRDTFALPKNRAYTYLTLADAIQKKAADLQRNAEAAGEKRFN